MRRRQHLDDQLQPCDGATVLRSVGLLRSVMAVQQVDEETRKLQKAAFLIALTKFPAWAVEAACAQFLEAAEGEGVHAPKPGEIAAVCRRLIAEAQYERAKINAVLDAEIYVPPTEEERARVAEAFAEFSAAFSKQVGGDFSTIKASGTGTVAAERQQANAFLREAAAKAQSHQESAA